MNKFNATLGLALLALLSFLSSGTVRADAPPDNVEGNWTIYSTNIEDGAVVIKHVQIEQYGNRITGYFEGPFQSGPIQGRVDVHHIVFSTVTRNVLTFRGQIYGGSIVGEYGIHGKHAAWQAVRTTGVGVNPQVVASYTPAMSTSSQPEIVPPGSQMYTPPVSTDAPQAAAAQPASYNAQPTGNSYAPAPLTSDQLDALVAPIALYPDALVAQVLAAATIPDEITSANQWLQANTNLTGEALSQAVDQQSWDPSVKALTQFPSVLANLANNLSWTSSLGQAFHHQQSDVMAAVQAMRAKAQAAGTLQSNSQITVTTPSPNTIVIQPANPQVVYVPQYNPTIVYGAPIVVPYYTPAVVYTTPALSFGVGVAFGGGGWAVGGGWGWGFHAWACNWGGFGGGGNTIIFNHTTYINNNTWYNHYNGYHPWGPGPHGPGPYGPHPYGPNGGNPYVGPNGYYHPDPGYHPGTDTHYGPNGAYHPNGYFGPDGGWHRDVPGTNPADQPNGGNNGNHGLIGGNGGVQNPNAGRNGPGVAPNGGYNNLSNSRGFDGGNSGDRNPMDHGENRSNPGMFGNSRMSGDGRANRMESNRGHASMAVRRPPQPHMMHERAPEMHSGGERRR
ncbi:MAG TPA: DUF3300 domain-containing protein [Candidatus Saccharimonadales bacterium]|nr:DUF3300 domain-containing protein [Candidatus Saccharimonadales bacterium]